jgi:hypothetical protein
LAQTEVDIRRQEAAKLKCTLQLSGHAETLLLFHLYLTLLSGIQYTLYKYTVLEFLNNLRGPRNRVGIGLLNLPARLHRLAEFIQWNRFLGFLIV